MLWRLAVYNIGCSKKNTKNELVNRTQNKRTKSLCVWPNNVSGENKGNIGQPKINGMIYLLINN